MIEFLRNDIGFINVCDRKRELKSWRDKFMYKDKMYLAIGWNTQ